MSELNLVDSGLELTDPNPDILNLFREFDRQFFEGRLVQNEVGISWSNRLLRCASVTYNSTETRPVQIRLILKFRTRRDCIETLLDMAQTSSESVGGSTPSQEPSSPNITRSMMKFCTTDATYGGAMAHAVSVERPMDRSTRALVDSA